MKLILLAQERAKKPTFMNIIMDVKFEFLTAEATKYFLGCDVM